MRHFEFDAATFQDCEIRFWLSASVKSCEDALFVLLVEYFFCVFCVDCALYGSRPEVLKCFCLNLACFGFWGLFWATTTTSCCGSI